MSGSLPIPFAVGETVWWCGPGYHKSEIVCPECVGTLACEIVLGTGERFSLECEACRCGYEPPRGTIKVEDGEHAPTPYVCQRVEIYSGEIRYQMDVSDGTGGYWATTERDLFRDRDLCAAECVRLNEEKRENQKRNHIDQLARHRKSVAWSAHYWRGEIARMERDLVTMRERLAVCPKPRTKKTDPMPEVNL